MTLHQRCICSRMSRTILWAFLLVGVPLVLAVWVLGLWDWDLSIPLIYTNADDIWQLTLTKVLHDTGWVLTNPYLGAPEVASWHHNAAAQTSALHSVLMLAMSPLIQDPVRLQQVYFLLNFPLICLTSFIACRLLGISRLLAFCVSLLFAFTSFRIDNMLYAFIANYFMVPLALVAVIWVLSGKFAVLVESQKHVSKWWQSVARLVRTREFLLGLLFVVLTAVSDGYYAFFTLLLLGFAAFVRALMGDWRSPLSLLPSCTYISALLAVSLLVNLPLYNYKKNHWSEFYPNGIEDTVLTKRAFEAEVYSESLKTIIAPIPQHRIEFLNRLGKWMIETSDAARLHKTGRAMVSLGLLGSLLFVGALVLLAVPSLRRNFVGSSNAQGHPCQTSMAFGDALLSLTLFIFLCSIVGGIGTLVALIFPTIRAYNRFPIFLLFVLYLGAAWFVTLRMQGSKLCGRFAWICLLFIVTAAAIYDQTPSNSYKGSKLTESRFLAERAFVQKLESAFPPNAMVYQYPYSQYLRQSKYYGWGAFTHIRLYLHSHYLRWSNGGAKNSPSDDWNFRVSQLPTKDLVAEIEALGFSGFVIDRAVLHFNEYQDLTRYFSSNGYKMEEDSLSNLTFVRLKDPGYKLYYDDSYKDVDRVVVTDPQLLVTSKFPILINGDVFKNYVTSLSENEKLVIRKSDHPEMFVDGSVFSRGSGQSAIVPTSDMAGRMSCKVDNTTADGVVELEVINRSQFNWKLGEGSFPLRIGVHIRKRDGGILRFDDGFRVPSDAYIRKGSSAIIRMPLNRISLGADIIGNGPTIAEFVMMQDGNAWFGNISCTVPLT